MLREARKLHDPGQPSGSFSLFNPRPLSDLHLPDEGGADTAAQVQCPFCWSWSEIGLDPGSGPYQEYVEDCSVCCRPWRVRVEYDDCGAAHVETERGDE